VSTQQAYINGFVKRASEYGYSEEQAADLCKKAFGVYDDSAETERWYDGGPMWNEKLNDKIKNFRKSPQHVAAMTRAFVDAAKRQGAKVNFMGEAYDDDMTHMSPEKAIANILAKKKLDLDDETLPNYYHLEYPLKPRKGLLEKLRLRSPDTVNEWSEGHPIDLALENYSKYL
jgi:hypothetical protein